MKLVLPLAYIGAVTNLMLSHGTGEDATLVPATAVKLEADVDPKILDELREGLRNTFFDDNKPAVPKIPELEAMAWKTEYEGGTLSFDISDTEDLDFEADDDRLVYLGVDVKAITFEPLATGLVAFKCNAIVRSDEAGRGRLAALLKHNVKATFSKLSQKPLAEPKKPSDDAAPSPQQELVTADGKPITPLMH